MLPSNITDGESSRNWKWKIVRTPDEWWDDYSEKHPEFDPYSLDAETFKKVYGEAANLPENIHPRRWYDQWRFMPNFFGDDYKYQFIRIGYKNVDDANIAILKAWFNQDASSTTKEPLNHSLAVEAITQFFAETIYNPMDEEPNLYLKFCRLSRLIELGWSPKKVKTEIIKFIDKYGPPWYTNPSKSQAPPFSLLTSEGPLTMEQLLWESRYMRWTVDMYRLLVESNVDRDSVASLKRHIKKMYEEGANIRQELDYTDDKNPCLRDPPLDTDEQVAKVAINFITNALNASLANNACASGLSNKPLRNSLIGAWIKTYKFTNLLGAMWLQFYFEILENGTFRECANENCRVLFPVSRSNKEYCSKECGIKQYMRTHRKTREVNHERPHRKEG